MSATEIWLTATDSATGTVSVARLEIVEEEIEGEDHAEPYLRQRLLDPQVIGSIETIEHALKQIAVLNPLRKARA